MRTAILVALANAAGSDGPTALLRHRDEPLIARVARQLREGGMREFVVLTRAEWSTACKQALADAGFEADVREAAEIGDALNAIAGVAAERGGEVVVSQADILTHTGGLKGLLQDPRAGTGILVRAWQRRGTGWGSRIERGRVVSVESPFHQVEKPNGRFLGVLRIAPADGERFCKIARRVAGLCRDGLPELWEPELARKVQAWGTDFFSDATAELALAEQVEGRQRARWLPDPAALRRSVDRAFEARVLARAEAARADVIGVLVTALVRADVLLRCAYLRELSWAEPLSQQAADEAAEAMEGVDEDRVLMESAVKANDGFFGTFFCSPYTKHIARWAAKRGIRPNQVTVFSFLLGVSAATMFAIGGRAAWIAGGVLLYFTLAFDCVDGQLARYTKRFTALGAWLDPMFDRWKEYGAYAALAYGGVRHGADPAVLWLLAASTMSLQTVRHLVDFTYAIGQHEEIARIRKVPITDPSDVRRTEIREPEYDRAGDDPEDLDESRESMDASRPLAPRAPRDPGLRGLLAELVRRVGVLGVRTSRSFEAETWQVWVKRIIAFPIGERYAAISITAAVATPRTVFIVMLSWGAFSLLYTVIGRTLRSVIA